MKVVFLIASSAPFNRALQELLGVISRRAPQELADAGPASTGSLLQDKEGNACAITDANFILSILQAGGTLHWPIYLGAFTLKFGEHGWQATYKGSRRILNAPNSSQKRILCLFRRLLMQHGGTPVFYQSQKHPHWVWHEDSRHRHTP